MIFTETSLKGSYTIEITPFQDDRGWFGRTYCEREFKSIGISASWVQHNQSYSAHKGTLRGMHYQLPPFAEMKLVRCIGGKVFDVIIDLRKNSNTFLKWFGIELSAENKKMIFIPEGFAHGFQTLSDHCELIYHHSQFYTPEAEAGINYKDGRIKIAWPIEVTCISNKDNHHPVVDQNFKGI